MLKFNSDFNFNSEEVVGDRDEERETGGGTSIVRLNTPQRLGAKAWMVVVVAVAEAVVAITAAE
jgi:hypothetical protein